MYICIPKNNYSHCKWPKFAFFETLGCSQFCHSCHNKIDALYSLRFCLSVFICFWDRDRERECVCVFVFTKEGEIDRKEREREREIESEREREIIWEIIWEISRDKSWYGYSSSTAHTSFLQNVACACLWSLLNGFLPSFPHSLPDKPTTIIIYGSKK